MGNEEAGIEPSPDVAILAERLARLLANSSLESRFHLNTMLMAAELDGVGGVFVVQVPRRSKEHAVAKWVGGASQLSLPI